MDEFDLVVAKLVLETTILEFIVFLKHAERQDEPWVAAANEALELFLDRLATNPRFAAHVKDVLNRASLEATFEQKD